LQNFPGAKAKRREVTVAYAGSILSSRDGIYNLAGAEKQNFPRFSALSMLQGIACTARFAVVGTPERTPGQANTLLLMTLLLCQAKMVNPCVKNDTSSTSLPAQAISPG
jgi:hypothetical protein